MKILILGAGSAQVDAIKYCKENGHEVFGCSYTNNDLGIGLLDHFDQINIVDHDAILKHVKDHGIEIIYSVGSDIAMPTVSYVSEKLNLPHFVSFKTAEICNRKHVLRETLGSDFVGNVKFVCASDKEELAEFSGYPGIIKPVDSQGQRGVSKVESKEDAISHFEDAVSYSREKKVILESFLDGPEVSANAYFVNGEMVFCLVSDRTSFEEFPGGIVKEHYLPCHLSPDVQRKVIDLCGRVAKSVGVENGPCYYQIKVQDGEPYLLEVTPRLDGCHMWRLIKYHCNVDLLDVTFKHLLYGTVDLHELELGSETANVRTVFMSQPTNTEVKVEEYPDALYEQWYYKEGEKVKRMNGYMEKCGYRIEKY